MLNNFFVAPNKKASLAEESAELVDMIHFGDADAALQIDDELSKKRKDINVKQNKTNLKKRKSS
jgi:hypothetical protein